MKVEYINPFIRATIDTFKMMMGITPIKGTPSLKEDLVSRQDISGIIGLSGEASGSIVISFPKIVALKVVSAFIKSETKILDHDVTDAIGEIANIIAGSAKKDLEGLKIYISTPNVVIGSNHQISRPRGIPCITVPFSTEWGNFSINIALKTNV